VANEPSIGLYHVSQHVRRSVPKLAELKKDYQSRTQQVVSRNTTKKDQSVGPFWSYLTILQNDVAFDMDFSISTAKSIQGITAFQNIKEMLFQSMDIVETLSSAAGYVV
jgi:hypothetical protein